jgi:hypothetical protein
MLLGKNVEFMLNLLVHKVISKHEQVKELNFICKLKYYTFILGGFCENSYLFIGGFTNLKALKITGVDNMLDSDGVRVDKDLEGNFCRLL